MKPRTVKFCLVFSLLMANLFSPVARSADVEPVELQPAEVQPKLIVVVSVDQLRRDRVTAKLSGGLGTFYKQGRVFVNASLDHAVTNTCPGHAVILSGVTPGRAGIPGNSFVDRETFEERYCVDDANDDFKVIGGSENRSPRNMKADTFGDWLKRKSPNSRVYSVGGKDRAVITMAGQGADGVYWYDLESGKFTSSGYYMQSLPDYIEAFNGEDPLTDGHLKNLPRTWEHGPGTFRADDYEGESETYGRSSGHPLAEGESEDVYAQVYRTAILDTQTVALAKSIISEENLGAGTEPDLLIIALSATDTAGHLYGPRSAEAEAILQNVDSLLEALIIELDTKLGKGNVLYVLTSDHGVAELPEYTIEKGVNSCPKKGRLSIFPLFLDINWQVYRHYTWPFELPTDMVQFTGGTISVSREYIEQNDLVLEDVLSTLDTALTSHEIVELAWRQDEIRRSDSEEARLLRNSLTEDRSGDILIQLHRDCVLTFDGGTTHGSLFEYDRNIPLMFYGWEVDAGKLEAEAHSIDIAPTLAEHIGLDVPAGLDGKVLMLSE